MDEGSRSDVSILKIASGHLEWTYYLLYRTPKGWKTIASLGDFWEGGIGGALNDPFEFEIDRHSIKDRDILRVDVVSRGVDTMHPGGEDYSTLREVHTAFCVLDDEPRCPLFLPTSYEYHRGPKSEAATEDPNEPGEGPVQKSWSLDIELSSDGKLVTIEARSESGEPPDAVRSLYGKHSL